MNTFLALLLIAVVMTVLTAVSAAAFWFLVFAPLGRLIDSERGR